MQKSTLLIQLYSSILTPSSTQQIKSSQQHLQILSKQPDFIQSNICIIQSTQISIHIRKLSTISLSKALKSIQVLNQIKDHQHIFQSLLALLTSNIDYQLKSLLLQSLQNYLSHTLMKPFKTNLIKHLQAQLKTELNKPSQSINYEQMIYIAHALLNKYTTEQQVLYIIINIFQGYSVLAYKLHILLTNVLSSTKQQIIKILQIIIEYSKLMKKIINKFDLIQNTSIYSILQKDSIQNMVVSALHMSINNKACLYMNMSQQAKISSNINIIKKNYLIFLNKYVKIVSAYNKAQLQRYKLYIKVKQILQFCISQTKILLKNSPYYQYTSQSQILSILFETLSLITTCLNLNDFYQLFKQHKYQLIMQILIPCLYLSPNDLQSFYDNSLQFIEHILQIVEKDTSITYKNISKTQNQDIQLYQTIKTNSSNCISLLCKYQDGLLSYLIDYIISIFNGQNQAEIPKLILLLILSILKNHIYQRTDIQLKLIPFVSKLVDIQTPVVSSNKYQRDIQYAYVLLVICKVVPEIIDSSSQILMKASKKGIQILSNQNNNDVYKYFMFQFFDELNRLQNGQLFALDIIFIYNKLIKQWNQVSLKLLDSYYLLLEYNIPFFKINSPPVLQGLSILCQHIQKQIKKQVPTQLIINKSFNIVRLVGQSPQFITEDHIKYIQQIMIPFLGYVDGIKNIDIEQDILLLLTSFIRHGKTVTNNQKIIFQIIPNIFYNQYKCHFGLALQTINTFIYYGSHVLQQSPKALQVIVEMAIANMTQKISKNRPLSELDNCQGVLILQSLILSCGNFISIDIWTIILQKITNRLPQISSMILSSNIICLICLCLTKTQNIFPDQQNDILLTKVLSGWQICCYLSWTKKILIAGLSQLLLSTSKTFISRRYTQILDIIISTLSYTQPKSKKAGKQQEQIEEFQTTLQLIQNNLKKLDEYSYFKICVNKIKMNDGQLLKGSYQGLNQQKKDFFNRVFSMERVANQNRAIYKIKK